MALDVRAAKLKALTDLAIAHVQQRIGDQLFPLPLSPMEKFLWWDDSPQHPLASFIELEFDGALDRGVLQAALQIAVHLHPLLSCCIARGENDWCWSYASDHRPQFQSGSEVGVTVDGRVRFVDLTVQTGLLAWHFSSDAGDRLLFQFHHACCDGNGFRRVLFDMLAIYVGLENELSTDSGDSEDAGSRLLAVIARRWEPSLLLERFDFSSVWRGPPRRPLTTWQRIQNARYFHLQLPEPLAGRLDDAPPSSPAYLKQTIGRELTERIAQFCQERTVRINELALAILFQTCARWHQEHSGVNAKRRIRLLMPYALMSRIDLRMPATNRLSFSFLGRLERDCNHPRQLLRGVQEEIKAMHKTQLPMDFLFGLQAASAWPGLMRWGIRRSRRMCTAVFSYGGDISRGRGLPLPIVDGQVAVGSRRLIRVFGAPPVRSNTHISLGACISSGEICIAQAWSRVGMSEHDARRFLQMYVDGWGHFEQFAASADCG